MSIAAQLKPRIRSEGAQIMAAGVQVVMSSLDSGAPKRTGQLRRSRSVSPVRPTATGFSVDLRYTAPQAEWTEYGTRPHIIRPRSKKVLRFTVGGRVVFAKIVHHPGNKAQHWFSSRVNAVRWSEALRRAVR